MKKLLLVTVLAIFGTTNPSNAQENSKVPIPTRPQLTWQDAELVAVFHYDGACIRREELSATPKQDHAY